MTDAKKPKAKPLSLYPMSFEEALRKPNANYRT